MENLRYHEAGCGLQVSGLGVRLPEINRLFAAVTRSLTPEALIPGSLIQPLQMTKSVGSYEKQNRKCCVVCDMHKQAGRNGLGQGACDGQRQTDDEYHQHWPQCASQLRRVNQAKTGCGHDHRDSDTEAASQHGIKKTAKEQLFEQRRKSYAKQ